MSVSTDLERQPLFGGREKLLEVIYCGVPKKEKKQSKSQQKAFHIQDGFTRCIHEVYPHDKLINFSTGKEWSLHLYNHHGIAEVAKEIGVTRASGKTPRQRFLTQMDEFIISAYPPMDEDFKVKFQAGLEKHLNDQMTRFVLLLDEQQGIRAMMTFYSGDDGSLARHYVVHHEDRRNRIGTFFLCLLQYLGQATGNGPSRECVYAPALNDDDYQGLRFHLGTIGCLYVPDSIKSTGTPAEDQNIFASLKIPEINKREPKSTFVTSGNIAVRDFATLDDTKRTMPQLLERYQSSLVGTLSSFHPLTTALTSDREAIQSVNWPAGEMLDKFLERFLVDKDFDPNPPCLFQPIENYVPPEDTSDEDDPSSFATVWGKGQFDYFFGGQWSEGAVLGASCMEQARLNGMDGLRLHLSILLNPKDQPFPLGYYTTLNDYLGYMWTQLSSFPDEHRYWTQFLHEYVSGCLFPRMVQDILDYNESINSDEEEEPMEEIFADGELDPGSPELTLTQCRTVLHHRIKYFYRARFEDQGELSICNFEMAVVAKMANVRLFRISAASVPSRSDSSHIAWLPQVSEMRLPPVMQVDFQSEPTDIFFLSKESGPYYRFLGPPSNPDSYIRDGRFFLEGIDPVAATATVGKLDQDENKPPGDKKEDSSGIPSQAEMTTAHAKRSGEDAKRSGEEVLDQGGKSSSMSRKLQSSTEASRSSRSSKPLPRRERNCLSSSPSSSDREDDDKAEPSASLKEPPSTSWSAS